jgi:hypothetical protein
MFLVALSLCHAHGMMARPGLRLVEPTARKARLGCIVFSRYHICRVQPMELQASKPGLGQGIMECWHDGEKKPNRICAHRFSTVRPLFHYSIFPIFQLGEAQLLDHSIASVNT